MGNNDHSWLHGNVLQKPYTLKKHYYMELTQTSFLKTKKAQ
jgi:hypothetical protein